MESNSYISKSGSETDYILRCEHGYYLLFSLYFPVDHSLGRQPGAVVGPPRPVLPVFPARRRRRHAVRAPGLRHQVFSKTRITDYQQINS